MNEEDVQPHRKGDAMKEELRVEEEIDVQQKFSSDVDADDPSAVLSSADGGGNTCDEPGDALGSTARGSCP